MKQFIIKVLVQLPNGKFEWCPIAKNIDGPSKYDIVKHENEYDAKCYMHYIAPDKAYILQVDNESI